MGCRWDAGIAIRGVEPSAVVGAGGARNQAAAGTGRWLGQVAQAGHRHRAPPQKAPGYVLTASRLGRCSIREQAVPGPVPGLHRARVPQPLVFARCPHRPQGRKSWHCQRVMSPRQDPVILSIPSSPARDLEPLKTSAPALYRLWGWLSSANMPAAYSPVTSPTKNKELTTWPGACYCPHRQVS